jgi:hypothetical protein
MIFHNKSENQLGWYRAMRAPDIRTRGQVPYKPPMLHLEGYAKND